MKHFASIHHPKKNTTMVELFAGSSGMALLLIATPPHGNLIAMGWSRAHKKVFL
jgi:hypothetical protein